MNDDELPMSAETASAYLDGELDAAERASATADPDTMAMVESFTQVRDALGEGAPVDDSVRIAALTAALTEFDVIHAAPVVTPAQASTPGRVIALHHRRMRAYRVLTGLAAAAIVVVVGLAALHSGSDSKASFGTQPRVLADESAALPAAKSADTSAAASAATPAPLGGGLSATSAAAMAPTIDSAEALQQYASNLPAAGTTQAPASATTTTVAALGTTSLTPVIDGSFTPACLPPSQSVLGLISFQGTPAFAVREVTSGKLLAIAQFDCRVLIGPVAP